MKGAEGLWGKSRKMQILLLLLQLPFLFAAFLDEDYDYPEYRRTDPLANRTWDHRPWHRDGDRQWSWMAKALEALMEVEDEVRARQVLRALEHWQLRHQVHDGRLRDAQKAYIDFITKLDKLKVTRRNTCPDLSRETLELLGQREPLWPRSGCYEIKETEAEQALGDAILRDVLDGDLATAFHRLDHGHRLYKMELFLMLMALAKRRSEPCIALWEPNWSMLPIHRYIIMRTYWAGLRGMPESMHAVLTLPHGRGVADRIALALGKEPTTSRLVAEPGLAEVVHHCRLHHHNRLWHHPHGRWDRPYRDFDRWDHPYDRFDRWDRRNYLNRDRRREDPLDLPRRPLNRPLLW